MEAFFLFCCEPCLRGDDDSREFYELLAVDPAASSEDIRSAYRRRALELHPDKLKQKGVAVTAQHNEQFNRLKDAYDVLSDPKRRRIYDRVGETGLNIIEGKAGSDPALFLKNLKKNKRAMFRIALLITALFGLLVLQPILLILKIDDVVSGSWFAIWIPMLLLDGILMLNTVAVLCVDSEPPEGEDPATWQDPYPLGRRLWIAWTNVIFVLLQIFILLNLDGAVDWSWAVAFIPWMIYEANQLLELVPIALKEVHKPDVAEPDTEDGDAEETFMRYAEAEMEYSQSLLDRYDAQLSVVASLMRVLFLILLAVKLDSDPSGMKWAVVFIPIWLYFGYRTFFSCYLCGTAGKGLPELHPEEEFVDPKVQVQFERAKQVQSKGISGICMMIVPLITAILLLVHLEDPDRYGVAIIFIPLFIVVGLAYLVTLCAFYAAVNLADQDLDAANAGAYSPPNPDQRDTDDSTTPMHPSGGQAPIVVPPNEPILLVPDPSEPIVENEPAQTAEPPQEAKHEEKVQETHIDLDVD